MSPVGISVVIPNYNQGCYLRKAIESALRQSYRPVEVIVVDGASTDNSREVLHAYDGSPDVRWLSEKDDGPASAVNKGLQLARFEIGAITSADDFFLPGAFEESIGAFRAFPRASLVYGDYRKGVQTGFETPVGAGAYSLGNLLCGMTFVPQGSAFFRMEVARRLGGWDARVPYVSDTDMWFRMALTGQVIKVDRFWSGSHVHPEQRTHQRGMVLRDYSRMIEQMRELQAASWSMRRAARAGCCIARLRYGSTTSDWHSVLEAWRAVMLYPPCALSPVLPADRLLPGYFWMAGWIGKVKRCFGFRTATGTNR